jgi:hypothetical protein
MSRIAKAAALVFGVTCAVSAVAQDAPNRAPKAAPVAQQLAPSPDAIAQASHPEAVFAVERAREARRAAACMQRRANAVEKAARRLDKAVPDSDEADTALSAVGESLSALDGCASLAEPEVVARNVEVLDDPCSGDPMCGDDVTLAEGLEASLEKANGALGACYQLALAKDPDRAG